MVVQTEVKLNLYDLTRGLARQFSQQFLGKYVEGIWHSGIVFGEVEWFFGGGIFCDAAGQTPYGTPDKTIFLGYTTISHEEFAVFLDQIRPYFTMETYDIVKHNCNNFSNVVCNKLLGKNIPEDILSLPSELLSTPLGAMVRPYLEQYRETMRQFYQPAPEFSSNSTPIVPSPMLNPLNNFTLQPILSPTNNLVNISPQMKLTLVEQRTPILFSAAEVPKVISKLFTFIQESNIQLTESEHQILKTLNITNVPSQFYSLLEKLLQQLPIEKHFPCLDLLRLLLSNASSNPFLITQKSHLIVKYVRDYVETTSSVKANNLMILRMATNSLNSDEGVQLFLKEETRNLFIQAAAKGITDPDINIYSTAASLFYNCSLNFPSYDTSNLQLIIQSISEKLRKGGNDNPEFQFTLLMTLGKLFHTINQSIAIYKSQENLVDFCQFQTNQKLKNIVSEILFLLK